MSQDWARLAAAIRSARRARGWTQHDLAAEADIGFSTVQRLEGAKPFSRRPPSLDRIERAFDWKVGSVDAILAGGDPVPAARDDIEATRADDGTVAVHARQSRLPRRIEHELAEGEVLDTEVIQLGNSRVRMIVVAMEPSDGESEFKDLDAWTRVQRRLRSIAADEDS